MRLSELSFLRDHWYALARVEDARHAGPRPVRLFGDEYVLWVSNGGSASLVQPYCPHRGAHLSAASVQGEHLVCCYHGWQYAPSGSCVSIPQLEPGTPVPPKAVLKTWPVVERYGLYWGCVGTPVQPGPPPWYEADELGWRVHVDFFEAWEVSALRIIDNNIDQSHPAFVHQETFGDPSSPLVPRYAVEPTPNGFRARIAHEVKGVGPQMGIADEGVTFSRTTEVELLGPLHSRILLAYGGSAPDYCFYGSATPLDDGRAMYVRCSALAGDEADQPYEMFHAYSRRVTNEDRRVLETTHDDFPLEATAEVHLRCDRTTLEYRRHLAALAGGPPASREPAREEAVAALGS